MFFMQGYHVEVKQLTMDAEHYLCVTIRTYASWAKRYISFTDYDMQILDVSWIFIVIKLWSSRTAIEL